MEAIKRYLEAEQKCVQLIAEFLVYNDFRTTLPIFIDEAISLDYRLSRDELTNTDHIKREDINKLTTAFRSGNHTQFFKAWKELIPSSIMNNFDYKKLTFYLHVHFAILPFRQDENANHQEDLVQQLSEEEKPIQNNERPKIKNDGLIKDVHRLEVIKESTSPCLEYDTDSLDQSQVLVECDAASNASPEVKNNERKTGETAMEVLKQFLCTEGETYSSQQEFLPFFALPYVTNPDQHSSFTSLFQEKWLHSLNDRFYEFIHQYSCGSEVAPKIVKMCEEPSESKPVTEKVKPAVNSPPNIAEVVRRYKQAKRKFTKLHRDHQNLIGVAAELTTALENSVRGEAVDLRTTLNNCAVIFPELFGGDGSPSCTPNRLMVPPVEPLRSSKVLCCSELDVHKIKSHLLTSSIKTQLLLLQAIRWRITKGSSEERDQAVTWLSRHDVLSVHGDLAAGMLQPAHSTTPHPLQQALARLVNTVASLRAGRDYLGSSQTLITLLVTTLKQDSVRLDTITSDMLLAALQKLSLRRRLRLAMIEQGVVEWLAGRLDGESERLYSIEYSTALLLNLCLHAEARDRCPASVLKLLTDLLDTGQMQIIPMVAGCLYCLLSHDRLNQSARQMDLETVLTAQAQTDRYSGEPQLLRQVQTLLRLLRGDLPSQSVLPVADEPSEDDLDDPETLEAELDADDPVKASGDDQSGEALLRTQYRRIFPSHGIVCPNRTDAEIAILPTTPRSRPPTREK